MNSPFSKLTYALLKIAFLFIGYSAFIGAASAQIVDSTLKGIKDKNARIAALPAKLYNADISSFEKSIDLSKRYSNIAYQFASLNNIDFTITSNISFSKDEFNLNREEILEQRQISKNRYINPTVFLIDAQEVLKTSNQIKITSEMDEKFLHFAKISGIDIIVNRAIYASDSAKITKEYLEFINFGKLPKDISERPHPVICSLSIQELLKSNYAKKILTVDNQNNRNEFYSSIDQAISDYAQKNNIDLIFDTGSHVKFCNITEAISIILNNK